MSGFCVAVCLLVCVLAAGLAAVCSILRGRVPEQAVLVVSPNVAPGRVEMLLRPVLADLRGRYSSVWVFAVADGERAAIISGVCADCRVEQIDRAQALKLWRARGAEFLRLGASGVPTPIPWER